MVVIFKYLEVIVPLSSLHQFFFFAHEKIYKKDKLFVCLFIILTIFYQQT